MLRKGLTAAWALPAALVLVATLVLLFGDDTALRLRYDRAGVASGQLLRLVSAHVVHLGTAHFLLNVAGLVLVWYLVGAAFSLAHWLLIIASSVFLIDLGFWFLLPELDWYVGLSGVLHGMLAAGIPGIWRARKVDAMLIAGILATKLGFEALIGPIPGSGVDVITEAHLLGAPGGFAAGMLFCNRVRPAASI